MVRFSTALTALLATANLSPALAATTLRAKRSLQNVVELVVGAENLQTLEDAVVAAELADVLSGEGPFTVFAPLDSAFQALPDGVLTSLLEPERILHLQDVLKFHVTSGTALAGDLTNGQVVDMLNGEQVTINIADDGSVTLTYGDNGLAGVADTDLTATNGVAHTIDAVLLPSFVSNNIRAVAQANGFNTLLALIGLVTEPDIAGILSASDAAYTVLAPTDDAFGALDPSITTYLQNNPTVLAQVLQDHVISGIIPSTALEDGLKTTALGGQELSVGIDNDTVTFNGATVVAPNELASNGIIHGIDTVLIPSILETAQATSAYETLATAVVAAGLADTLSSGGPFTVFAPNNDAFLALATSDYAKFAGVILEPGWKLHLQEVIKTHVVEGVVFSTGVEPGTVPTLGADLTATVENDTITLSTGAATANVGPADIVARDGVIHNIDDVLIPAALTQNIVEVAQSNDDFSTLVELVIAADLVDELSTEFGITVFAPTNAAFAKLDDETLALLKSPEGKDTLSNILLYHVCPDVVNSDMILGEQVTSPTRSLAGPEIEVTVEGTEVKINDDATVTSTDILASNGIIHVIDTVLIPPEATAQDDDSSATTKFVASWVGLAAMAWAMLM